MVRSPNHPDSGRNNDRWWQCRTGQCYENGRDWPAATLLINTSGTSSGGDARLGNIVANSTGLNRLISTPMLMAGPKGPFSWLTYDWLVLSVPRPSSRLMLVHDLVGGPSKIFANGTIDLSESVAGRQAGSVNFSKSTVVPTHADRSKLTITTSIRTGTAQTTVAMAVTYCFSQLGPTPLIYSIREPKCFGC